MTCCTDKDVPTRDYTLYKGTDFFIDFRLSDDDGQMNPDDFEVRFIASPRPAEPAVFDLSSGDSPTYITHDDENIITVHIPAVQTSGIAESQLYYQINTVDGGVVTPRMTGNINCIDSAGV